MDSSSASAKARLRTVVGQTRYAGAAQPAILDGPACAGWPAIESPPSWCLAELRGRLAELSAWSGSATLTLAVELLWKAQEACEPAAWVTVRTDIFFPPDLATNGIDLDALPVVRTDNATAAARATEKLLRSAAFGLVIVDLGRHAGISPALQSRLSALTRLHDAAVLFLTDKPIHRPSLGPLVSLRVGVVRQRPSQSDFRCTVQADKDKRRGPGWTETRTYRAPPGLH